MPDYVRHASLSEARQAVMADVSYVEKTGKVTFGGSYKFAGEADLISAVRPAMVRHGIVVAPVGCEYVCGESYDTKNSVTRTVCLRQTYRFRHVHSGEFEDVQVMGEAGDTGDKRCPKAMTIGQKYALRQFFLLETGDDPDSQVLERQQAGEAHHIRTVARVLACKTEKEVVAWQKHADAMLKDGTIDGDIYGRICDAINRQLVIVTRPQAEGTHDAE